MGIHAASSKLPRSLESLEEGIRAHIHLGCYSIFEEFDNLSRIVYINVMFISAI